jgi:ABC-type multidrug transport system ATPase subunit
MSCRGESEGGWRLLEPWCFPLLLDIQTIIRQLKSKGIGIIITDHNVRETLGVCDRAYILNDGQLLEEGTPEKIAQSQKARKIYLGEEFELGRKRHSKEEGKKEISPPAQGRLWD